MVEWTYRPIDAWPAENRIVARRPPYRAEWGPTLRLLDRELRMLGARNVVVQVALAEADFRVTDGHPRAHAKASHPGVVLAFDSRFGPLKYATGEFDSWQANIRAIALSLEALRKVDRYGVSKRGEQYRGWKQLAAGGPGEDPVVVLAHAAFPDHDDPRSVIAALRMGGDGAQVIVRRALRHSHPDTGGSAAAFNRVMEAREALGV